MMEALRPAGAARSVAARSLLERVLLARWESQPPHLGIAQPYIQHAPRLPRASP